MSHLANSKGAVPREILIAPIVMWFIATAAGLAYLNFAGRLTPFKIDVIISMATGIAFFVLLGGVFISKNVTPQFIEITDNGVIGKYPPKAWYGPGDRVWLIEFDRIVKVRHSWFACSVHASNGPELDMSKPFPQKGRGGYMPVTPENAKRVKEAWDDWKRERQGSP